MILATTLCALLPFMVSRESTPLVHAVAQRLIPLNPPGCDRLACLPYLVLTFTHDATMCACAGGTFALFKSFLPLKCNIHTTFVDISDLEAVAAAITPR